MGRILRWRLSEGVYHVYNRDLSNAMILPADDEKNLFCDLIRKKLEPFSLNVYHQNKVLKELANDK